MVKRTLTYGLKRGAKGYVGKRGTACERVMVYDGQTVGKRDRGNANTVKECRVADYLQIFGEGNGAYVIAGSEAVGGDLVDERGKVEGGEPLTAEEGLISEHLYARKVKTADEGALVQRVISHTGEIAERHRGKLLAAAEGSGTYYLGAARRHRGKLGAAEEHAVCNGNNGIRKLNGYEGHAIGKGVCAYLGIAVGNGDLHKLRATEGDTHGNLGHTAAERESFKLRCLGKNALAYLRYGIRHREINEAALYEGVIANGVKR